MCKKIFKISILIICAAVMSMTVPVKNVEAKPKSLSKNVKVGDAVYFGKYEQDGKKSNGAERLTWRVLDKKEGKALILTEYLIDMKPYHKKAEEVTWENSYIRKWLNKDFVKAAFSSSEIKKIRSTTIENNYNDEYEVDGGEDTTDKVFLLSIDEAYKYFDSEDDRRARITDYYRAKYRRYIIDKWGYYEETADENIKRIETEQDGCDYYWLRSPGMYQYLAANVNYNGRLLEDGNEVDCGTDGIRPALWIEL